jgi:hypothetical protein
MRQSDESKEALLLLIVTTELSYVRYKILRIKQPKLFSRTKRNEFPLETVNMVIGGGGSAISGMMGVKNIFKCVLQFLIGSTDIT